MLTKFGRLFQLCAIYSVKRKAIRLCQDHTPCLKTRRPAKDRIELLGLGNRPNCLLHKEMLKGGAAHRDEHMIGIRFALPSFDAP
jgi:hypothetical protein